MRCSKDIFKQLSQSYLKFRNTARYCLGNLNGFDPNELVVPEDMMEIDRWAITKLNELLRKVYTAYNGYEFHVISHAINDFCVVELSSFYLDIIKDRLYCEEINGLKRRSAQTALYMILDAMTRAFAPILAFTCNEIWLSMPHRAEDDERNVVLNDMVHTYDAYALDEAAMAKWDKAIALRDDVNGVLETARAEKRIGKALEAHVELYAGDDEARSALEALKGMNLAEIFIVSECAEGEGAPDAANVTGNGENFKGMTVEVYEATGEKCCRCWMHSKTVGQSEKFPELCARCAAVLENM